MGTCRSRILKERVPAGIGGYPILLVLILLNIKCFNKLDICVFILEILQCELICEDNDRTAENSLAGVIRKSFSDTIPVLNGDQEIYAGIAKTCDMLDYSRATFNKAFRTSVAKIVKIWICLY